VDPDNQEVVAMMLLAITDQFGRHPDVNMGDANRVLLKLQGGYERSYYAGVIAERWGKRSCGGERIPASLPPSSPRRWTATRERWPRARRQRRRDSCAGTPACRFMERNADLKPKTQEAAIEAGFSDGAAPA